MTEDTANLLENKRAQLLRIKNSENGKKGSGCKGQAAYVKFTEGAKLTQRNAIYANCFECMGFYVDGREDCKNTTCLFYQWMPYAHK